MAGRRIIYLLSLAGSVTFFLAYKLWFGFFVLVLLLVMPLFSLAISLPAFFCAKLDTTVFCHTSLGTHCQLRIHCGKLPTLPWRCKLKVLRPLSEESYLLYANDFFPTDKCGTLLCTVQKLKVYDYLGLFSRTLKYKEEYHLTVYPQRVSAVLPEKDHFSALSWRPKWGGGFAENHELRLYRPGDNIQQIHWKLSAKTGELIYRQPMESVRSQLLVRLDLSGDQQTLERKLGKLYWLGPMLLRQKQDFQIQALTGDGVKIWFVSDQKSFFQAFEELLGQRCTREQLSAVIPGSYQRQYYIGGESDEA